MDTIRKAAIIVGGLYILGTVAGILSVVFTGPILNVPLDLSKVSTNGTQIVLGALSVLSMGLVLAMVPVMMFPILKKQNEALALGYVVFRGALETVTYIATAVTWFFLFIVSREYVQAGPSMQAYFQALGASLPEANAWISQVTTIIFILGAGIFYSLLFRSELIPRWISGWGLAAAIPYFAAGLCVLFGLISSMSTVDSALRLPLGVQEMVLAIWLIVKGFNPAAIASLSVKVEPNQGDQQ